MQPGSHHLTDAGFTQIDLTCPFMLLCRLVFWLSQVLHGNQDDVDSNEEFAVVVTREDQGGLGTGDAARTPLWQVIAVVVFAVAMAASVGVFAFNVSRVGLETMGLM
jgi:hypothetical protein